ncbi:MAG: hypothetical protein WAV23_00730 [Minisyncoccia bacterium]
MINPEKLPQKNLIESKESTDITVFPPAEESLLYPDQENSIWPDNIKNNQELKLQIEKRRELSSELDSLFNLVPHANVEISQAVDTNLLDAKKAASIYNKLSSFLESEEENSRIVLYLPFELIPAKTWQPKSEELKEAKDRFLDIYLKKWKEMLSVQDVRESFNNGDIPEKEIQTKPLTKVTKAAHFIPLLVEKNIISAEEVIGMIENSKDETLRESITDTIPVLADMNLLSQENIAQMSKSTDTLVCNMAIIVKDNLAKKELPKAETTPLLHDKIWLDSLVPEIKKNLSEINDSFLEKKDKIPEARATWEKQIEEGKIIEKYSNEISIGLSDKSLSINDLQEFIDSNKETSFALTVISGIKKTIEESAEKDPENAKGKYIELGPLLEKMWNTNDPEILSALEGVFSQLAVLGVVDNTYLEKLGTKIPKLDANFSTKKIELQKDIKDVSSMASLIESNKELSKFLYPILIMYGSKIKGYDTRNADIDIAMFVKPGTEMSDREHIQKIFSETISHEKMKNNPLEFWLKEKRDELEIEDFLSSDQSLGDSRLAHVLFEGVWCGSNKITKELYEKLLSGYLYSKDKKINDIDARKIWLKALEHDTLQYRLMHRGYSHFYPKQGGINTEHSNEIDSQSTFWDSGYRRLATKLFIDKVFLPQLEK